MHIRVILFRKDDGFISKCISVVTGSDITHSAVMYGDVMFDSSEKRGNFGRAHEEEYRGRVVEVYSLNASHEQFLDWLFFHTGKKYDYKGLIGWIAWRFFGNWTRKQKLNSKKRVYCFEATANLIARVKKINFPVHLSGADLKSSLGVPEFSGEFHDFLKLL